MADGKSAAPIRIVGDWLRLALDPLAAIAIAVVVGGLLVLMLRQDPLQVYATLFHGSLVGWPNILTTLQLMTPLLFTGLSVSICLRAGLINIGAEGQMLVGGLAAGIVGYAAPLPHLLLLPACLLAAIVGGGLWAAIPAALRVFFDVSELVVCLMMNPIAQLGTGYVATHLLKAPGPTNKLPDVADAAFLSNFSLYAQVNTGLLIGLLLCIGFAFVNARTVIGLEWRLMGLNPGFAHYGGIRVRRNAMLVMMLGGGIAGLAGAEQVLGEYRAFYENFSPGYGFDGVAVAMLARFSPIGVIFAAFLFGALNSGGAILQMMTGLTKDLVQVIQFIIVLVLSARFSWRWLIRRSSAAAPNPAYVVTRTAAPTQAGDA